MFAAHHTHSFDGIHPNEKGYAIVGPLAQAVIDKTLCK
jgi:lysophospholipase L1-like esterase